MRQISAAGHRWALIAGSLLIGGCIWAVAWNWSALLHHDKVRSLEELPLGAKVRLLGVVTYIDLPGKRFWMQDETVAVAISGADAVAGIHVGQAVAVNAVKTSPYNKLAGVSSVGLKDVRVSAARAQVKLPPPVPLKLDNFPTPEKNGIGIRVSAVLRAASVDSFGRAHLTIADSGPEVELTVAEPGGDYSRLVNARIEITALPEQVRNVHGARDTNHLWAASGSDIRVVQAPPASSPVYSLRALYRDGASLDGRDLRIRGRVARVYPSSILLEDRWGAIECNFVGGPLPQIGAAVEVTGFPSHDGLRIDLFEASAKAIPEAEVEPGGQALPAGDLIATVGAIRQLPQARAAMALPAHVVGRITYIDPQWRQLYVQDATGGIYVKFSGLHPELTVGQVVTLAGLTNPGNFAPVIVAPTIRPGGAAPVPIPLEVTVEKAAAGLIDAQLVTIEGVVRPMKIGEEASHSSLTFELVTSIGRIHVYTSPSFPGIEQSRHFEDARVRIHGVLGSLFNPRRQLVGYQLLVESPSDIEVIEPAVENPFEMRATPVGDLLRYSPQTRFGHRVKIAGTVTLVAPDFVYLQDSNDGVEVRGDASSLQVGEWVEAIGYPTLVGRYSPVLSDAAFRPAGRAGSVLPKQTSAEAVLSDHDDARLVTVEGKLLMALAAPGRQILVLQSGVRTFTAHLDTPDLGSGIWDLQEGSLLRLTGVVSTQVNPDKLYRILEEDPTSFQILLRSPQDLTVIHAAPFWSPQRTLALLAVFSLLILVILAWVGRLRRRVRQQTAELKKASETTQAIRDLSAAMLDVSSEQRFDAQVSVRGTEEIAQLVVGFNRMLTELWNRDKEKKRVEAKLQRMALIDELTGLPNRRLLFDRLAESLARARRESRMLGVLYIDLDGFKTVNDSLGHGIGDLLLTEVARRLRTRARRSDTLARIGGDEFTLILDKIEDASDAQAAAESLLKVIAAPFQIGEHSINIGASIGIGIFPAHADDETQLLQRADCAMYAAKQNGKNRIVQFGDDLGNAAWARLTLESDLRRAIADGDIKLEYQPEFDLATNQVVRFEALARWRHATIGNISPLVFIPVAEESGLIVPMGAQLMEMACEEALKWQSVAGRPIQVAVNVSSVQFARDTFVEEVAEILKRTGLDPYLLQIELTESATLTGIERAEGMMHRLKDMGVSVAMDDFGTGYSCLSYLSRLPIDALKIDRSFVTELMVRPTTLTFVRSILTMGHNLQMKVIVEGIETLEQFDLTKQLGADEAQGFLLGRPCSDPIAFLNRKREPQAKTRKTEATRLESVL